MIVGFRSTVEDWLDLTLRADVFVAAPSAGGARSFPTLSPDVEAKVAAVPGVAWVETFRSVRVASPLGEVNLGVADPRRARDTRFYRLAEGDVERAWDAVRAGAVLVTEPFAFRHRLPAHGATVTLVTDHGPRAFPVAGVLYDYAAEQGTVFMTRNVYERHWDDRGTSSVGAHLAPGASVEEVTHAMRAALAGTALRVSPNRSLRAQALRIFDRTFAVTRSLRLLAVVVAFIGVWSALLALQVERTRELATLTVLGLGERQQWALGFLETGLMGAVAGLLALPLGWLLAFILVHVINVRSFGWTMRLAADPWLFVQAFLAAVGAAVLACLGLSAAAPAAAYERSDITPVIAPIGIGACGETLNINADTAAGALAAAAGAKRLLMLTDVEGVLDRQGKPIPVMTAGEARRHIADGTISGGMIPKVETCLEAVSGGVEGAAIIDGRVPHALLLELFTEYGVGTLVKAD